MEIRLEEVTRENYREVLMLSVAEGQRDFVMSNCCSVAQSKFFPLYRPRAVYADGEPVGFLMYGPLDDARPLDVAISRLMVDQRWQRQGIGREALRLAIGEIRERGAERITIYYEPENAVAKRLYAGFGFVEVGEDEDGEVIAELSDLAAEA